MSEVFEKEVEKEHSEHPWLTKDQARKIVLDHHKKKEMPDLPLSGSWEEEIKKAFNQWNEWVFQNEISGRLKDKKTQKFEEGKQQ